MRILDQLNFNLQVLQRHRVRTLLLLLAVGIGVSSVILLTSLGEGARRYVDREFSSLGNRLLIVFPGRNETTGGSPPIYGTSPRDLTIEDAEALKRIPGVSAVAPVVAGTTVVSRDSLSREAITLGSTPDFFTVRQLRVGKGSLFSSRAYTDPVAHCILGVKVYHELFGNDAAIGEFVRLGDRRMRIIGILEERGESLGLDFREMVIIPVHTAMQLFDSPGLFRVMVDLDDQASIPEVEHRIREVIKLRHEGEDDITIISQEAVLAAFSNILTTLTLAIGAISAISLLVAGILIMNISLISVSQRRREIGLLKALGASAVQVRELFIGEALLLVSLGALAGFAFAFGLVFVFNRIWPAFPLGAPWWAVPASLFTALATGLLFSLLPARRAAALDPVLAMRSL